MLVLAQRNRLIKRNATNVTFEGKTIVADFADAYGKIDPGTYVGKRNKFMLNTGGPDTAKPPAFLLFGSEVENSPTLEATGETREFSFTKFFASYNTSTTPEIGTAIQAQPAAAITTGLFGRGALGLTGSGAYVRYAPSTAFNLLPGDFAIRFWYRHETTALGNYYLFDIGSNGFYLQYSSGIFRMCYNTVVITGMSAPGSILTPNVWHHIMVARKAGVLKLFLDGNIVGQANSTVVYGDASRALTVGSYGPGGYNPGAGTTRVQDFQIDKDYVPFNFDGFAVPTAPSEPAYPVY